MENKKGTNKMVVFTYPDKVTKYSNEFSELHDVHIKVEDRSIYCFGFESNFAFQRDCRLSIKRIPASPDTKGFNPNVKKANVYKAIAILSPEKSYVNSGSNAIFKDGKSRIIFPLQFPENTVEWYYKFAASRDDKEIDETKNSLNLVGELTTIVGGLSGKALNVAIDQLTQPPGSNYCDIYLLNQDNMNLFEAKKPCQSILDGTRENLKSGVVQVKCCMDKDYYLGILNPDNYYGIATVIEGVAITKHEELVMEQQ
jgi:hypothetical protein